MTEEAIARLRAALEAGPTSGPWFVPKENAGSKATSVWARGGDVLVAECNSTGISLRGRQADACLIAAANPEAIRLLLAKLDSQDAAVAAAYDKGRSDERHQREYVAGWDAAMKPQGSE